jgi:predicted component of type VI protein secretion system
MPYRIIILNGEKRGERLEVTPAPLVIGTDAGCPLQVSDPGCGAAHAELSLRGGVLFIKSLSETFSIRVNETPLPESRLKHGDVIQIGTTRFFIQEFAEPGLWDTFSRQRNKRVWLMIGIILLLVSGGAFLITRSQHDAPGECPRPAPVTEPLPATAPSMPDDSIVTNVPRIRIDPSVILTTKPPELVEATMVLNNLKTNRITETLEAARLELEMGARFLLEKQKTEATPAPEPLTAIESSLPK